MPTPVQNIASAVSAYANAVKGGASGGLEARDIGTPNGEFAGLVKGAIQDAVNASVKSEQVTAAVLNDKADLSQVVTAVAEAEITLRTVVAIRDKVIEAYREIIRMPI
jgi:flagellar hook-basal body complex protein FliE